MIDNIELSYSFHLSNDKNKSKRARSLAKSNKSNTTSFSNNAIQNLQQLSKADKHNLRKYDNNQELIKIIKGTSSVIEDTKKLYLDLFEDARIEYNNKQTRNDRKIDNYFNHISNDNKHDLVCEIIIELGDMDFWSDKDNDYRYKMIDVFKGQIDYLEEIVPTFKIANAVVHFDETSPHIHIVGVPVKDGGKNGMSKQVGKAAIFTKDSLTTIQDKMREHCINTFNKVYGTDYILKEKEEGRNQDILVNNMTNYKEFKKEQDKNKKKLKELNQKCDNLSKDTLEITNMIDNLKVSKLNKDNYIITNEEIKELKDFIDNTKDTTSNMKSANDITLVLEKYEDDLKNHNKEVINLQNKVRNRDKKINELEEDLSYANDVIEELEDKVDKLQELLNYFKNLWKKLLEFLKDKFFSSDKYDDLIQEMYDKDVLSDENVDIIQNNEKEKDTYFSK